MTASSDPGVSVHTSPSAVVETRHRALDGLRGVAALVVVVHHCLLVAPGLAAAYRDDGRVVGGAWWLVHTPAHLLWAGGAAVTVFFVLSGFVLTLPFLRPVPPRWRVYYPQRIVRLHVPVAASVALAAALLITVGRAPYPGASWAVLNDVDLTWRLVARDVALVGGTSVLNGPLWSLRWEVLFSLGLPVYLWCARRAARSPLLGAVAALAVIAVGDATGKPTLTFLPTFAFGVLLAAYGNRLAARVGGCTGGTWAAIGAVAVAALLVRWWPGVRPFPGVSAVTALGAVLVVALFLWCPPVAAFGRRRPTQWLGKRSFSLYLVHAPIVNAVAVLLATTNAILVLAIAVPVSLTVAAAFFVLVEAPAQRLARRAGHAFGGSGSTYPATRCESVRRPRDAS